MEASSEATGYVHPKKRINSAADFQYFCKPSKSFLDIMTFILECNESVKSKKISEAPEPSKGITVLIDVLETTAKWITEIPPISQNSRFGNKSFRDWYDRLCEKTPELLLGLLPENKKGAIVEVAPYFVHSFGDRTRIDYGTGHENAFICFLLCLMRSNALTHEDMPNLVLRVFPKYLDVTRTLQTTYWLEPAGSHGVWGLDDYSFIPFLWGSAQLIGHKHIKPKSISSPDHVMAGEKEYLYLSAIAFINKVKKGPFGEHSPMLSDISHSCPHWEKVNGGMIKMYIAEVMQKYPVIQHSLFGTLIDFDAVAVEGARLPYNVAVPAPSSNSVAGGPGSRPGGAGAMPMGMMPGAAGIRPGMVPPGAAGVRPGVQGRGEMHPMGAMPAMGVRPGALPGQAAPMGQMPPPGTFPGRAPWPAAGATMPVPVTTPKSQGETENPPKSQ